MNLKKKERYYRSESDPSCNVPFLSFLQTVQPEQLERSRNYILL